MEILKKTPKNQNQALIVVFIVALIVGFAVVYSISSNDKSTTYSKSSCSGTCVSLFEDKASPDTLTVKVGDYVQFNSADGKSHNLSLGKGGEEHGHKGKFYSGEFKADEAWRVQFKEEGTFFFHDHLNPKITILVVVYTPDKEYKIQ